MTIPTYDTTSLERPNQAAPATAIPTHWYNILADLDFDLPPDVAAPGNTGGGGIDPQLPLGLVRQEMSRAAWLPIPPEVRACYDMWRPSPLRRATALEKALGTGAALYYKYEGGNLTGSHKLNTALAQAYYYRAAGARKLVVATGAGQWGTAVAAACRTFGLECQIFMVRSSLEGKPYRRTIMELLGASVTASPSRDTEVGRRFLDEGEEGGTLSIALGEALEAAGEPGARFCAGSGETYSLLHQTVIGLESIEQMRAMDAFPDVVLAGLGAGSNFGGLAFPFLRENLRSGARVRAVSVEPAACPKLTHGVYAYDYTDSSEKTPMQKMYTLGYKFTPPAMHAGGLRYHGTAKIVSALYDRGLIEATAYQQRDIFTSATLFSQCEGIVPAPESAHAVHGAIVEAQRADERGEHPAILFSLSGHGMFDMGAYRAFLDGQMDEEVVPTEAIAASLSQLPPQPDEATVRAAAA